MSGIISEKNDGSKNCSVHVAKEGM